MKNASTPNAPAAPQEPPDVTTAQPPYVPAAEAEPVPPQPAPLETPGEPDEEIDLWWGAYSGWTMAPSWVACVVLTGLIAWAGWLLLPRGFVKGTILGLASLVWLVQGSRWAYRIFGYNYRLTTRRLYADQGFVYRNFAALDLTAIERVEVRRSWSDRLVGVGQVRVIPADTTWPPLVLDGVGCPGKIAERVREQVRIAQGGKTQGVSQKGV